MVDGTDHTGQIIRPWAKNAQNHNVMIVRKLTDSRTELIQGTAYSVSASIGDGTVIYNGSDVFLNDSKAADTTYDYKFYSENWSGYSAGDTAQAPLKPASRTCR